MSVATATSHETYSGLRRQFVALQSLATSLEEQASRYRKLWADQTQNRANLDAELATNLHLTEAVLAAEAERDQLKADNEEMRKDAERYRWLRKPWQEQRQVKAWTSLEAMDENIDVAMAKEANRG